MSDIVDMVIAGRTAKAAIDRRDALLRLAAGVIGDMVDANEFIICEATEGSHCGHELCAAYGCMEIKNHNAKEVLSRIRTLLGEE